MVNNPQQVKYLYKNLPEKVQSYITSPEVNELITIEIAKLKVSEDQTPLIESQVFDAMIGAQTLDKAVESIALLLGKPESVLVDFKQSLQGSIFDYLKPYIKVSDGLIPEPVVITQESKESVLNQLNNSEVKESVIVVSLPNNLPVVEKGEVAHDVPHVEATPTPEVTKPIEIAPTLSTPVPTNPSPLQPKPPQPQPQQHTPKITHYPGGIDPYREPLE